MRSALAKAAAKEAVRAAEAAARHARNVKKKAKKRDSARAVAAAAVAELALASSSSLVAAAEAAAGSELARSAGRRVRLAGPFGAGPGSAALGSACSCGGGSWPRWVCSVGALASRPAVAGRGLRCAACSRGVR